MAKAKSGGTRSYLRGRIASDVYSIGRDANGKKQQVVRSLAETVKNPQTIAQMRGRMIMSTVMQAVSGLSQIIDHSFDNVPNGQPSISEFIRRNYALVKDDVLNTPATGAVFGLNKYQEKGAKQGEWLISDGKAVLPSVVKTLGVGMASIKLDSSLESITAGAVRSALGLSEDDYLTFVGISTASDIMIYRLRLSSTLSDETVITNENVASLFSIENVYGTAVVIAVTSTSGSKSINFTFGEDNDTTFGIIISKSVDGGYEHNTATIYPSIPSSWTKDEALATYPVGEERFLNGGEL